MASPAEIVRVTAARERLARWEGEAVVRRGALLAGIEVGNRAQTDFKADRMIFAFSAVVTLGGVLTSLTTPVGVVLTLLGVIAIYLSGLRLWQGYVRLVDDEAMLRRDRESLEALDARIAFERSILP